MSFWHGGVQFSILLFFFASILESLVVFIHVKWIEPAYISNLYEKMIEMAQTINIGKSFASRLAEQPLPSIFSYIISNVILADVFLGFILSLIVVPTAMRLKKTVKYLMFFFKSMDISVVIPLFNEEDSLQELHDWIKRVMQENGFHTKLFCRRWKH